MELGESANSVKMVWNCDSKIVYGESSSSGYGSTCNTIRTYDIQIDVTSDGITFTDDHCADITFQTTLASQPFYVYIGADCDSCTSTWDFIEMSTGGGAIGTYSVSMKSVEDDYQSSENHTVQIGDTVAGAVDYDGDEDTFIVSASEGDVLILNAVGRQINLTIDDGDYDSMVITDSDVIYNSANGSTFSYQTSNGQSHHREMGGQRLRLLHLRGRTHLGGLATP